MSTTRTTRLARSLKLRELAVLLGRETHRASIVRLMREIRSREAILGETILRHQSTAPNSPLVTTLPVLKETFPEWFDSRVEMENLLRSYIGGLEDRLDELKGRDQVLARKILKLEKRLDAKNSHPS